MPNPSGVVFASPCAALRPCVLTLTAAVVLAALGASSALGQGPPDGLKVNVVNPPSDPVPIVGVVSAVSALPTHAFTIPPTVAFMLSPAVIPPRTLRERGMRLAQSL